MNTVGSTSFFYSFLCAWSDAHESLEKNFLRIPAGIFSENFSAECLVVFHEVIGV